MWGTDKTKTRVTPALRLSCLRGFEQLDLIVVLDNEIGEGSARVTRQSRALLFGMMNAGDLVQVGRPQQIYDRPCNIFVAQFVGTPSINLLNVTTQNSGGLLIIRLKRGGSAARGLVGDAGIGEDDVERSVRNNCIRLLRAPNVKGVEFRSRAAGNRLTVSRSILDPVSPELETRFPL